MTAYRAAASTETGGIAAQLAGLLASAVAPQARPQRTAAAPQPAAARPLAPEPGSVKLARDFTRSTLRGWGMAALCGDAVLVVSELLTNALRYGVTGRRRGAPVLWLRLLAQPPYLMCMVFDTTREIPLRRQASPDEATGRGLQVIESCCSRWGWHLLDDGGKVVWALLPRE